MRRAVGVTIVALVALLIMQFVAIRRMRLEISRLRADAAALAVDSRQDEIVRAGLWLHTWLAEEASRAGGLCPNGAPDIATINKALFGTYLHARAGRDDRSAGAPGNPQHAEVDQLPLEGSRSGNSTTGAPIVSSGRGLTDDDRRCAMGTLTERGDRDPRSRSDRRILRSVHGAPTVRAPGE